MRVLPYQVPLFVERAEGALIYDVSGRELIDMNMGYGPLIFGHRPTFLLEAIKEELGRRGTIVGIPHELSHLAAELVRGHVPSIDLLRFASTGSEANQTAIRLARAYTGRRKIVLFEGHYNGSTESVFHRYHAPVEQLCEAARAMPLPGTEGMGNGLSDAYVIPWNDLHALQDLMQRCGESIAAVMMEPVMGNAGVILPCAGFLPGVRRITQEYGAVLIFDEVITGFRVALGGAQGLYEVRPDITTLSKAMSGGMPVSAVGGKREIMHLIVEGRVFHGGVYSGNPVSIAATLSAQREFRTHGVEIFRSVGQAAATLRLELTALFEKQGIPVLVNQIGGMLCMAMLRDDADVSITDYRSLREAMAFDRSVALQHRLQERGVFVHPNPFEPWFISTAHTSGIIDRVLDVFRKTVREVDWRQSR
jgi:glutamate-1-semialdehyde 2,1-aminomutase